MGCKYVKDFKFDSANGYTGSTGKTEVKAYMRGGAVRKAPLDAAVPKQTPTDMRPLRTANAKTAMKEATQKRVTGSSGKIKTAGQYAKGGAEKKSGKYADGGYVNQSGVSQLTPEEMAQANSAPTGPQRMAGPGVQLTPAQAGMGRSQPQMQQLQQPQQRGREPNLFELQAQRNAQQPQARMSPLELQQIQRQQQQIMSSPEMRQMQMLQQRLQNSPMMQNMQMLQQRMGQGMQKPSPSMNRPEDMYNMPSPGLIMPMPRTPQRGGMPQLPQGPQGQIMGQGQSLGMSPPGSGQRLGQPQQRMSQSARSNYKTGGMACATGCQVEMKKGGKSKKADKKAPAKKPASRRNDKQSDAMAEQVLMQMLAQASQTGSMPGVPMQGMPMPAPGARAVPTASQAPMLPMKSGGMSRGQQAKVGRVMGEYKRGDLHSGSKSGPVVKNRDQAVAIAMSEARKKRA
jgi:hypothetical protein